MPPPHPALLQRPHVIPPRAFAACLLLAGLLPSWHAAAAPYVPRSDTQVVEKLPTRRADPRNAEIEALRAAARERPGDADAAVALARRHFAMAMAEGDPRYAGRAQAALGPWWAQPAPPPRVRVMRAVLLQYSHAFEPALADLDAVVQADPTDVEAWAWLAAIHMVRAEYGPARRACERAAPHTSALLATACSAYVDSLTGQAAAASRALGDALQRDPGAPAAERLWAWTRLAEIDERRGDFGAAERGYRAALALGQEDNYLLCAYADFLLDRGRAPQVLALLKDQTVSDTLLLRLALAAKAASAPQAAAYGRDLAARFEAARLRGDTTHQKEASRFALGVQQQPQQALQLALDNYAVQREPADARVLLEAALAARRPAAADAVLHWMEATHVESAALATLAQQIKGLPR